MKICFIGTYDRNYSRNQVIFNGLGDIGAEFEEIHVDLAVTKLDNEKHMSLMSVLKRILKKLGLVSKTFRNFRKILNSDVLFVAYPGVLDIPFVFFVAKVARKPLIYDPLVSTYVNVVKDFGILSRNSITARLMWLYEKVTFNAPDILLADTEMMRKFYHNVYKVPLSKIKILYLGANDRLYKSTDFVNYSHNVNVVYYGLYNPIHGVEFIVEAARICINNKSIKFVFIGDGQTFEKIFNLAKKYKLINITFYKDLTEKDSMGLLRKADIFLGLFKKSETVDMHIPNKIAQGAALSKAVITPKSESLQDIFIHKKNIFFCKTDSGESIAEAILTLQQDTKLREKISKNASRVYLNYFTPRKIASSLANICQENI